MLFAEAEFHVGEITGGIDPFSPLGIFILLIGVLLTVGLPVLMILKGKKE